MPQQIASGTQSKSGRTHKRSIVLEGYRRDDGLRDIESRLTDGKNNNDDTRASGVRPEGEAVNDMFVGFTVDNDFTIVDADAALDWTKVN